MSIEYKIEKGIAQITLDDGKVNAMDGPLWEKALELLDLAETDNAKAVILCGREGIFSAGVNFKVFPNLSKEEERYTMDLYNRFLNRIRLFPCPTIAQVTGSVFAGGFLVVLACDYIVALDGDYKYQMTETAIGLPLPSWCIDICASKFSQPHLDQLALLAVPYSPSQLFKLGAIQGLASTPQELADLAYERAQQLSKLANTAFKITKNRLRGPGIEKANALVMSEIKMLV